MQMLQTVPCTKQSKTVQHIGSDLERDEGQVNRMDRKEAIERIQEVMTIIRTQHMCKDMDGECTEEDRKAYIQRFEALRMAIEALQEKERKKERCEYCKDGKSFIGQVVILLLNR